MRNSRTACLLLLLFLAGRPAAARDDTARRPPAPEGAAFHRVPDLEAGFQLLYEQKFSQARGKFVDWSRGNPGDPFGDVALAASYLFEEFHRQGIMTSDYFLDDDRFLHGIDGEPDEGRLNAFNESIGRAARAAKRRLKKDSSDAEALFVLTLASGMQSNALSILQKKHLDGLGRLKDADDYAGRLLRVRPDAADAWLALGSANYIIGSLSGPVRFFLWFGGFHGDRALGMAQLGKAAAGGRYLRPYAKMLLALAARREGQDDVARQQLLELTREFPQSPLFASEFARATAGPTPKGRP